MDNKDSGSNFALWIPGGAVILSLVVSTFALTRAPFFESRPAGSQFQVEQPIEARLWQDPFDALERFRKRVKAGGEKQQACTPAISDDAEPVAQPSLPAVLVVPIEAGPYADEVELRRRVRYALLAGLKNAHLVPEDEQHVRCLSLAADLAPLPAPSAGAATDDQSARLAELPYESFAANPFDPASHDASKRQRVLVFWLKQQYLDVTPLARLERLRLTLSAKLAEHYPLLTVPPEGIPLKVIGPSNSTVLRNMLREDRELAAEGLPSVPQIEIYSPLATADKKLLLRGIDAAPPPSTPRQSLKLLRTISDDATLARLLLDELKRRAVDPAQGLRCRPGAVQVQGLECRHGGFRGGMGRVALISEWDSFYARALSESFKEEVARRAGIKDSDQYALNDWVLRYSYLRGLDGRLPEDAAAAGSSAKDAGKDGKSSTELDLAPLEKSDGNSQLDYLRRLADYIARQDEELRDQGGSGIGAIGVLGTDAYDKLLVLQALKSRMPAKLYFSTDLDARMLQRGQAETARNLVLAAPYGLTLTRDLQQDVPPFRDSLQSAVFVAVLAAQAPQSFEVKRERFDYSSSPLLSPGIYEVGISGFIALASSSVDLCQASASIRARSGGEGSEGRQGIMQLDCLQDPPPPPYPEPSKGMGRSFDRILGFWHAGPLSLVLLGLSIFLGWWWTSSPLNHGEQLPAWVRNLPLGLYVLAAVAGWAFTLQWRVEYLWATFVLILLGIVCSQLNRRLRRYAQGSEAARGLFDSQAYYLLLPLVIFVLVVLWGYQQRRELTDNGLGEPMFLFEGISAWPTAALRLLAVLISLAALAWGWRCLRLNRLEIERAYHLPTQASSLWRQLPRLTHRGKPRGLRAWLEELGRSLFLVLFPLSSTSMSWLRPIGRRPSAPNDNEQPTLSFRRFWREHCICGTFGARMIRAILATWIFVVATSVLFVFWPFEGAPIRGQSVLWKFSWMIPTLVFQLLVFWVVDANRLLSRFIRQLSRHRAVWPWRLQREHEAIFHLRQHPCIDAWMDMMLIARRSAAVNRLIYAPTLVLLILIASRSSYFDNWPTPPSLVLSYLLTALILFISALSLRRAAEKARGLALQQVDEYLLRAAQNSEGYDKFKLIRERIAALNTGAFSRYSEEPLVRALLLSLTGIGGSAIVDALNFAKF